MNMQLWRREQRQAGTADGLKLLFNRGNNENLISDDRGG